MSRRTASRPTAAEPSAAGDRGVTTRSSVAVAVEDLTVAYHHQPVLWDIDVDFPRGELTAIVGPNGAGKSTLVKAILGLVRPASGRVRIFGQPIDDVRRRVAYVPQRGTVDWDFPTDALDVVMMGRYGHLGWFRRPGAGDRSAALDALDRVGMARFAGRQISQLSGGQKQRVFLARALVQAAEVYLMDEPFAGVDATTERAIVALLRDLREAGRTVVVVHHDLTTLRQYFDHLVLLNVRVRASGPMEKTLTRANLEAAYGGQVGRIEGLVLDGSAE